MRTLISSLLLICLITACGQKGPLTMPDKVQDTPRSAPQTKPLSSSPETPQK
ncbi:LPS translocon maturation chaperone LptM [Undibacterium rugosum]|uniref:Lipoprotein n=1 Tax=Undibacterium rugosum TaxID=2762291 RepID=A0A923I9U1_9BURK|nr:lipoprotein [Undibacterium rugosum]MBR7777874.1 lipoprotein [Undibacterium rugosum]